MIHWFMQMADCLTYITITCRLKLIFFSGTWKTGCTVDFSAGQGNLQFDCGIAIAPSNFTKIKVQVSYTRQMKEPAG